MTRDSSLDAHVLDTGPLLCLGGSAVVADLYDEHLQAAGRVVEVVVGEVSGLARLRIPPGDPYRQADVKRAGAGAMSRYRNTLFSTAIPTPDPEPPEVPVILRALEVHAQRKRTDRETRAGEHAGEAYSIHEAEISSVRLVSNDDGARQVARQRGVTQESFVDIARRLAKCQHEVKPRRLVSELLRLARVGIDVGDSVPSVLDF